MLVTIFLGGCAAGTQNPSVPPADPIVYRAISDFGDVEAGDVPYYKDMPRAALAINAAIVSYRDKFARALTPFQGPGGTYDVTLTTLAEFDGESTYRVLVNGRVIGTVQNTPVPVAEDYKPLRTVFRSVKLSPNDVIGVESNSHTNGLIPEGDGTAWARGRWSEISFVRTGQ